LKILAARRAESARKRGETRRAPRADTSGALAPRRVPLMTRVPGCVIAARPPQRTPPV